MYSHDVRLGSAVQVQAIRLKGPGILIITGPSSCGKGEVSSALCRIMSVGNSHYLSMGEILRSTVNKSKHQPKFKARLALVHKISDEKPLLECDDATEALRATVLAQLEPLSLYFNAPKHSTSVTPLEWLEYCTYSGILIPDRWTQCFIEEHISHIVKTAEDKTLILDGYPRTVAAAKHLLDLMEQLDIPVIKIVHMSISMQEMLRRAVRRGREDDSDAALLSRYQFYIDNVQPSIDYIKERLGSEFVALVDAHQPHYDLDNGVKVFNLERSILNVVVTVMRNLGVPRTVIRDLLD